MKTILKSVLLILASSLHAVNSNAQTDVRIIDFSVLPVHRLNAPSGDSVNLSERFKINKAGQASKANLWLGTAKDSGDVFIAQPVFNTVNNVTTLAYNNSTHQMQGYETVFYIKMSNQQYKT